jgi:hypothetical protein
MSVFKGLIIYSQPLTERHPRLASMKAWEEKFDWPPPSIYRQKLRWKDSGVVSTFATFKTSVAQKTGQAGITVTF